MKRKCFGDCNPQVDVARGIAVPLSKKSLRNREDEDIPTPSSIEKQSPLEYRFKAKKGARFSMYGSFEFSFQVSKGHMNHYLAELSNGDKFICSNLPVENNAKYVVTNSYKSFFQDSNYICLKYDCILHVKIRNPTWKFRVVSQNGVESLIENCNIHAFLQKSRNASNKVFRIRSEIKEGMLKSMNCMIVGDSMSKKSLLVKHYANLMIKHKGKVIILQSNPEGGIFNPPGILSILQVNECIFDGFNFSTSSSSKTNGIEQRFSVSFGHSAIDEDVDCYKACIETLKQKFQEWTEEGIPFIMDTSSYTNPVNQNMIELIFQKFQPDTLIVCYKDDYRKDSFIRNIKNNIKFCSTHLSEDSSIISPSLSEKDASVSNQCNIFEIQIPGDTSESLQSKICYRHQYYAILSHYFDCEIATLYKQKYYKTPWSAFSIYIHGLYQNRNIVDWISIFHILNGSFVSLVKLNNPTMQEKVCYNQKMNNLPLLLGSRRVNQEEYLGIGIIAHIDMIEGCFYILAPQIPQDKILKVNMLHYCSITIPRDCLEPNQQVLSPRIAYDIITPNHPAFYSIHINNL